MRKFFYATAALSVLLATLMAANAADEPPYARPVAPPVYLPQPFSWTGFYIGLNLGGAWSQRNLTDSLFGLRCPDCWWSPRRRSPLQHRERNCRTDSCIRVDLPR